MLLPDHISIGLLISSRFNFQKSKLYVIVTFLSVILPDLPVVLFGAPGTIEYLSHRKYTNSVLLAPIYSLIPLILLSYWIIKNRKSYKLWLLYTFSLIGYFSHIFLDLITEYGDQPFYPFTNKIYSWDILHSFDPFFLLISVSVIVYFLYCYFRRRIVNSRLVYFFVGIYTFYFLFAIIQKEISYDEFNDYLISNEITINKMDIVPRTYWRWRGIADAGENFIVILKEQHRIKSKSYPKNIKIPENLKHDTYYKQFIDYARFPAIIDQHNGFAMTNLIYSSESYRLVFKLDKNNQVDSKYITGFTISDPAF